MSCLAPASIKETGEAPACGGVQIGAPPHLVRWSCPFCTKLRTGVVQLEQVNTDRLKKVAELSELSRTLGVGITSANMTGARLQRQICDLVEGTLVDLFKDSLTGKPPCHYAFLVCGSLARREASAFSDIDALLVLENDEPETLKYFSIAMAQMGGRLYNAGGYSSGFRFCPGGLTPANLMGTPARIFDVIDKDGGEHMRGALSPRFVFGTKALATDYLDQCKQRQGNVGKPDHKEGLRLLRNYVAKKRIYWMDDEQEGWKPPPRDPVAVQVKCQFYRPVTMIIEALAIYYGAVGASTRERVLDLIKKGSMSVEVGNFVFNILDDTAKIRTGAHVREGREFEAVKLRASKASDFAVAFQTIRKVDIDDVPVADRPSIAIALALTERMPRFWTMTEKFVSEMGKTVAISRTNPFKTTRP